VKMKSVGMLAACLFIPCTAAVAQPGPGGEIEQLRAELRQLRSDYDQRITALEQRLAAAEARADRAVALGAQTPTPQPSSTTSMSVGGDSAFNPAIGIIFQGQAWHYDRAPEGRAIAGFPVGGEAEPVPEGLALGETEIDISANVDDLFTAWLTVPVVIEEGEAAVEIEEAWIETLGLPGGLSLRFGRFFSDIGYLNSKHAHTWDFVDQPLAYQAFLGNQYLDDGVQARWIAPTALYFELGAEILRGGRYPAAGAANSGYGAWSAHARLGGDVGFSSSWLAGFSYLSADSIDRESGDEDEPLLFTGDADLLMAEFTWKWAPAGNWRQRNFKFQAEYLWRDEKGTYTLPDGPVLPWDVRQEGWYLQAVYQPFPTWRFGARYDALSGDYPGQPFAGTPLDPVGGDPRRYSLMVDWSHSEFSRLRLQYTDDRAAVTDDRQWGLQYIHSIGAHGAHSF
jgi:hypothetical protein